MKKIIMVTAIIIVAVICTVLSGRLYFSHSVKKEVMGLFRSVVPAKAGIISGEKLSGLPAPVRKYLRFAGITGKKEILSARFIQEGYFRTAPDGKWLPLEARQYFTTEAPGFIWFATVYMAPGLSVSVRDCMVKGRGNMLVKLLSLLTLDDVRGREIDQGVMLRYLGEMIWFPTAFVKENIRWEAIDERSARAFFTIGDATVTGIFRFGEGGEVESFSARRYMSRKEGATLEDWTARIHSYMEIDGIRIPRSAEVLWHLKSGDYSYARLEIAAGEFNITRPY